MTSADYETSKTITVEIDGTTRAARFRVLGESVIVYVENEIKFAQFGMNRPEVVARWLITDLCRRLDAKKRKAVLNP